MMRPKVLNLIQRFEQLSNSMSNPKREAPLRQKSIANGKVRVDTPPASPSPVSEPSSSSSNQLSWKHNPLMEIEQGIQVLNKQLVNINTCDEKVMLAMFMEMMDLLLKISSIDTDGLKALKAKKECCLADLRSIKEKLQRMSEVDHPIENESKTVSETPKIEVASSTNTLNTEEEDPSEEKDSNNSLEYPKSGSVRSLSEIFSIENQTNPPVRKQKEVPKIYQNLINLNAEIETDDEEIETAPKTITNRREICLDEINSQIAYYKEEVPLLDLDDFIKLESIEEQLQELMTLAEGYKDAQKEILSLLQQISILNNGGEIENKTDAAAVTTSEFKDDDFKIVTNNFNPKLIKQCREFLLTEQNNVFVATNSTIPQIIINEPAEPITVDMLVHEPFEQHSEHDDQPSSIQVLEINIPGQSNLAETTLMIESYKTKIKEYLSLQNNQLINMEDAVNNDIVALNNFQPDPKLVDGFNEIRSSYQDLLDIITETKFSDIFNQTFDDCPIDPLNNLDSMLVINNLHALCAEVKKYYTHLEKLDEATEPQIGLLWDNIMQVRDEIMTCDVTFDEDLQAKKEDALMELDGMLKKFDH